MKMDKKNIEIKQVFDLAHGNHVKNNFKLAESLYKKILKIDSEHFSSIFMLGCLYLQKKNLVEAIELLSKALQINPKHANTLHNLGYAFIEIGKPGKAMEFMKKVLEIEPKHPDAHFNLGNIYKQLGEYEDAEKCFRKSILLQPNDAKTYNNLGNILKDSGKFQEAINSYKKAIEIQFNHANAYHNLGNTYKQLGNFMEAKNSYSKAYKYQTSNLETLFTLKELDNEIIDFKLIKQVKESMQKTNANKKDIAYGNFLLSKYELQKQNYESEFNYLLKGHSLYFDFKKIFFERGINYWLNEVPKNEELMNLGKSNQNNYQDQDELKPIFIVGVPRCGSTLIEKIIASGRKKISAGEETTIISSFLGDKITKRQPLKLNMKVLRRNIIERYKVRGLITKDFNYTFTDKSLDNFFFIGFIKEIFPNAKIINCKRNIISSIVSIVKNNLGDISWAHNLEHIFQFFDNYLKKIELYKKMHGDFIYDLEFEKFVDDPINESKKLMSFCDLPWDKGCLEYYKKEDMISRTASNVQIRKAIYKDPKDKNLPYKQFLRKYGRKYPWFK